ncbi:predicted protein [Uncinocarpus reesii 1704]|uniref:Allantoin permease n=1 Tax=Uncinocarpus reesii (strain UAMH 1704) TaxID=336963 RepID=C4JXE1_UNCRE|nr:uncharacterized protein UREG_06314 [Uncinocarpus reesii 1704]EEP81449.1 predicted protein [Uncinocarpus reesii 1704]
MAAALLKKLEVDHEGGTLPNRWVNNDIKPIEAERRTWTTWTFTNYWILVNSNISTYMTGSSLVALGLSWWQAIIAIVVGNGLATAFVVLNSLPGAYYHIGFPVVNRYVWGFLVRSLPVLIQSFGFQAYVGGQCVYVCLTAIWPSLEDRIPNTMAASTGITTAQFASYIIFMVLSLPVVYIRPHKLRLFFHLSSSVILVFEFVLLIWALATMGPDGFGSTITSGPNVEGGQMGWTVAFGIISTIGGIAAGILNQNDYARFACRPRHAIIGQTFSFPICAIVCSVIGILVTAATQNRYGEPLWNLPDLFLAIIEHGGPRSRAAAFFSGLALIISQMGVNVPGNALSGVFLGPMTGLMISSWFVVNKRKIKIEDLFVGNSSSIYWCTLGVDWRAVIAWVCGTVPSLPGFIAGVNENITVPEGLVHLYQICFLAGFAISASVYCGLHFLFPVRAIQDYVANAAPADVLIREYREACDSGSQFKDDIVHVEALKVA